MFSASCIEASSLDTRWILGAWLSSSAVDSLKTSLFMNPPLLLPSPSFRWHFTRLLSLQLKPSDLHMRSSKESCPAPCPAHIRSYSAAASNEVWKRGFLISPKQFQLQYPSLHVPLGGASRCLLPVNPASRMMSLSDNTPSGNISACRMPAILITTVYLHTSTCQCLTLIKVTVVGNSQTASLQVVRQLQLADESYPTCRLCVRTWHCSVATVAMI